MYKDQIYKLEYYRQRLIDQALRSGEYISDSALESALEEYDIQLALFKHRYIQEGSKLNVNEFNNELYVLYNDLLILYRTVYELTVEKFNDTKDLVNIKLSNLERIANQYYNRSKLETIAIFGDTLVFQSNNFDMKNKDGKTYVKLPAFTTYAGSTLAFLANLEDNNANVVLELSPKENILNYESNESLYQVPGEPTTKTEFFSLDSGNRYFGSYQLPQKFEDTYKSQYYLYSGHNMIKVDNQCIELNQYNNVQNPSEHDVEFYIYKGTHVDFSFTLDPIKTNINNHLVTITDKVQYFKFRMPPYGQISFNTDGIVFAAVDNCIIKDNHIYSRTFYDGAYDNMLEIITYDKEVSYDNPVAVIENPSDNTLKINSLAIKQNRYNEYDQV